MKADPDIIEVRVPEPRTSRASTVTKIYHVDTRPTRGQLQELLDDPLLSEDERGEILNTLVDLGMAEHLARENKEDPDGIPGGIVLLRANKAIREQISTFRKERCS